MAVRRLPQFERRYPGAVPVAYYHVCDTEAELPEAPEGCSAYTKDTQRSWKRTASAWVEVGGAAGPTFRAFTLSGSGFVWTNMPAAATELGGGSDFRTRADLSGFVEARLVSRIAGGTFLAGMTLKAQYSTNESAWSDLTPTVDAASVGTKTTAWTAIPAGAKSDVYLRVLGAGGNGAQDPRFGVQVLQVR